MIPLRVKLRGFLCYKEEQEISFDGASLWMLAGLNGSGKSAVFDAVTYALFGHHRGGAVHAVELINKNADGLTVEFDFLQDGQAYRLRRTLQRNSRGGTAATQMVLRRAGGNGNGHAAWEPIDGTSRKTEFDAWVRETIGLGYETFTSSVLLLQGKAEKLLDSTAKGRFEVLAGIVDLDRYERLYDKADEVRKSHVAKFKTLENQLAVMPQVSAAALVEADARTAAAEDARGLAREEVDRMQILEFQARQWAELQTRLNKSRQRRNEAQHLLADAPAIERDVARLAELRLVLPHLQTVVEQRNQMQEAERKTNELNRQREKLAAKLAEQDHTLEQASQKRTTQQTSIADEERRQRQAAADLLKGTAILEKLRECERQENDLARLQQELGRLPADPTADEAKARDTLERLQGLDQSLPLLIRLRQQREEVGQARDREKTAAQARLTVEARGKQCAADVERFKPQAAAAAKARQQADEKATRTQTLLEQGRQQLNELLQLHGAKLCRHCGQELTEGHLREEKVRREKLVREAGAQAKQAAAEQQAARIREDEDRSKLAALDKSLAEAREEFVEHRGRAEQARIDVDRLQVECGQTHALLPEAFRSRVATVPPADWQETTFPSPEDLAGLAKETSGLPVARQRLREAEGLVRTWTQLTAKQSTVRDALGRVGAELPADREGLRRDHARLESEVQALDRSLIVRRRELTQTQEDLDRLAREREQTQQHLTALQGKLSGEEATRRHCQQTLGRALKDLPGDWKNQADKVGLADLSVWNQEKGQLVSGQTEERGRQLQHARLGIEVLKQEVDGLDAQLAALPVEAHRDPAEVVPLLEKARQAHRDRDDEVSQARQQYALLESQRQQREQTQQEKLKVDRELAYAETLAKLLGRERLQLHLVRQAERQVVDHANAVLDRLSGGELYLRLCGEAGGEGNTAKALEMEAHNRTTGEKPINVMFLSGSQKFRVAVSLALGIGQYASRQHRPLESVIIDEGFGCLDRNGRQVMIQELQNLRSHMRCILLVSHQDEIANAFADGYRFELTNGSTVATRFQK